MVLAAGWRVDHVHGRADPGQGGRALCQRDLLVSALRTAGGLCATPWTTPYLICALRTAGCLCAQARFQPTKLLHSSCANIAMAGSHFNSSPRADIAKAGSIVGDASGLAHAPAAIAFAAAFTALCYFATPRVLDRVNSALVVAVVASFLVRCLGMCSNPQYCAARGHCNVSYSNCVCALLFNTACMSHSVPCCWAHGTDTRCTFKCPAYQGAAQRCERARVPAGRPRWSTPVTADAMSQGGDPADIALP